MIMKNLIQLITLLAQHHLTTCFTNINTRRQFASKLYSTATLPNGIIKQVTKNGNGELLNVGDVATVKYSCYVSGDSSPFAISNAQKVVVGDGLMIDGWEISLPTMSCGECATIQINDPRFGYGAAGVPPFIPSNAPITMNIEVLEAESGVDLGTIASADPLKPRTPASIAAAYSTRRELASLEEANQLEGIEGLIARFKTFYFFGFFEGETGQQAPWYLRPSITFPIAFAAVGAAFYVLFLLGGITNRGAQVTDELDEFILEQTLFMLFN